MAGVRLENCGKRPGFPAFVSISQDAPEGGLRALKTNVGALQQEFAAASGATRRKSNKLARIMLHPIQRSRGPDADRTKVRRPHGRIIDEKGNKHV
jgi:hypothetical protein